MTTFYMHFVCVFLELFLFNNVLGIFSVYMSDPVPYEPKWDSLDNRPTPKWYDEAKIGIFIHWGVFSVPSFGSEWFWMNWHENNKEYVDFMKRYPLEFTYQEFAKDFTAEFFDAREWVDLFQQSGAKYIVLTSKHHEGYTLWPSKYSFSWNSVDIGPHRDLIDELVTAIRNATGIRFGLYHSLYEWFNPLYLEDKKSNFTKADFIHQKILPEMTELVEKYEPEILWSDGDWEATDEYWQSKEFLAWLYNESPVKESVLVNDRWGSGIPCHHGDFYTCSDRYNPGVLQNHKWENAMTIDKGSWGYRRNAKLADYLTAHDLIETLIQTISCGGNILINIGPTKDGIIAPIYQERLSDLGQWLSINCEAIYASVPWKNQNDTISETWYTSKPKFNTVYAITLIWPEKNTLNLGCAVNLFQNNTTVTLMGNSEKLKWLSDNRSISVFFPDKATVRGKWAWVVKISN